MITDRLAALAFAAAAVLGADAWWAARDPVVRLAPGGEAPITGFMAPDDALVFAPSAGLTFRLVERRADAWLGRPQWRGVITAAPDRELGAATLEVRGREIEYPPVAIAVVDDAGRRPSAALAAAALAAGAGLASRGWRAHRRRAAALAAAGRAEVLWVRGHTFGFADLPVAVGDALAIERDGVEIGRAAVTEVSGGAALAAAEAPVPSGAWVRRAG